MLIIRQLDTTNRVDDTRHESKNRNFGFVFTFGRVVFFFFHFLHFHQIYFEQSLFEYFSTNYPIDFIGTNVLYNISTHDKFRILCSKNPESRTVLFNLSAGISLCTTVHTQLNKLWNFFEVQRSIETWVTKMYLEKDKIPKTRQDNK